MNLSSATYVQVYPNPSSDETEFAFQLPSNFENYDLEIYDSSGHAIKNTPILANTTIYKMEVKNLSSGIYFFTLNSKNKILQTGKFIITK